MWTHTVFSVHTYMCEIHLHSRHSLEPVSRERLSRRFLISTYMASGSIRIQGEINQISVGRCINVNRIRNGKDLVMYPAQTILREPGVEMIRENGYIIIDFFCNVGIS